MAYNFVPIVNDLDALKQQVVNAQTKGTYTAQQQHWDAEVAKILTRDCTAGEHNVTTSVTFVDTQRRAAQSEMNIAEKTLKQSKLTKEDLQHIEQLPARLQQCVTRIEADQADLIEANLQYRENWSRVARECLSQQSQAIVDPYLATRKRGIDNQPLVKALQNRIAEYIHRAEEYVKQAKQKFAGEATTGGIEAFRQDLAEIKNKMLAGCNHIKELHQKKSQAIKSLTDSGKTKQWTEQQKKDGKSYMDAIAPNAKNARGQLKTLEVLYDGLENRAKKAGPGWKDFAAKEIKEAKKPLQDAREECKAFTDDEDKCRKILKEHGLAV